MKVEKISSDKFKITFTDEDLRDFDVDFENLRYNSEDAQEIFWHLLEQADIEDSFFDDGAQIVVEAVAAKDNGLTMTVTRVADRNKLPKIRGKKERRKGIPDISPLIYSFDDFEKLVCACKHLENMFVGVSRLYKMEGEYYLVMDALHESVAVSADLMLCEYGEKVINSNLAEGKLAEYGDILIKDTAIISIAGNL